MAIMHSHEFVKKLMNCLGIDGKTVTKFSLDVEVNKAVTVTVAHLVDPDPVIGNTITETFELVPK